MQDDGERAAEHERMVETQLHARGITDSRVLQAFLAVPRHRFVPPSRQAAAYEDRPLPIAREQTISQPFVVAYMLQKLDLKERDEVLEIGTGSGYQTALLAEMVHKVYSIEFFAELATQAGCILSELGYKNTALRVGDGLGGWPGMAGKFDSIVGSAAAKEFPVTLAEQLRKGGQMILPVGGESQHLLHVRRARDGGLVRTTLIPVRFVLLQSGGPED